MARTQSEEIIVENNKQKFIVQTPTILFYVSILFCGLFNEYWAAWGGVALSIVLSFKLLTSGKLKVKSNGAFLYTVLLPIAFLFTALFAVDKGEALFGFVKFLPLLLFILLAMQYEDSHEQIVTSLPVVMTVITIVSAVLMQFGQIKSWFSVANRLSGTLQYPNTFALLLLTAIIVRSCSGFLNAVHYVEYAVLVFGLLYTGSRAVFVLFVLAQLILLFRLEKKPRIFLSASVVGVLLIAIIVGLSGRFHSLMRFLTASFTASTFVGRILYYKDALRIIVRHPFGLGYLGYFFLQSSFQTGVYSVRFVHNDLLQMALDIGWIPAIISVVLVVRKVFSKNTIFRDRVLIIVISLHSLFDFDLQYISVSVLLLLLLGAANGKKAFDFKLKIVGATLLATVALFSVWLGAANFLYSMGKYQYAAKCFPAYTEANVNMLIEASGKSDEDMTAIADRILSTNEYVPIAYTAKAHAAFGKGDFAEVIKYKEKAISLAPYSISDYNEYAYMLYCGKVLYLQSGDKQSSEYCAARLRGIPEMLERLKERTDALAYLIKDQPQFELDEQFIDYLK